MMKMDGIYCCGEIEGSDGRIILFIDGKGSSARFQYFKITYSYKCLI